MSPRQLGPEVPSQQDQDLHNAGRRSGLPRLQAAATTLIQQTGFVPRKAACPVTGEGTRQALSSAALVCGSPLL